MRCLNSIYQLHVHINQVQGLYGGVFAWGFRTDQVPKERGLYKKHENMMFLLFFSSFRLFVFGVCHLRYLSCQSCLHQFQ